MKFKKLWSKNFLKTSNEGKPFLFSQFFTYWLWHIVLGSTRVFFSFTMQAIAFGHLVKPYSRASPAECLDLKKNLSKRNKLHFFHTAGETGFLFSVCYFSYLWVHLDCWLAFLAPVSCVGFGSKEVCQHIEGISALCHLRMAQWHQRLHYSSLQRSMWDLKGCQIIFLYICQTWHCFSGGKGWLLKMEGFPNATFLCLPGTWAVSAWLLRKIIWQKQYIHIVI